MFSADYNDIHRYFRSPGDLINFLPRPRILAGLGDRKISGIYAHKQRIFIPSCDRGNKIKTQSIDGTSQFSCGIPGVLYEINGDHNIRPVRVTEICFQCQNSRPVQRNINLVNIINGSFCRSSISVGHFRQKFFRDLLKICGSLLGNLFGRIPAQNAFYSDIKFTQCFEYDNIPILIKFATKSLYAVYKIYIKMPL